MKHIDRLSQSAGERSSVRLEAQDIAEQRKLHSGRCHEALNRAELLTSARRFDEREA